MFVVIIFLRIPLLGRHCSESDLLFHLPLKHLLIKFDPDNWDLS